MHPGMTTGDNDERWPCALPFVYEVTDGMMLLLLFLMLLVLVLPFRIAVRTDTPLGVEPQDNNYPSCTMNDHSKFFGCPMR